MKRIIYSIIAITSFIHYGISQSQQFIWDLKLINTQNYQDGITQPDQITDWRKSYYNNSVLLHNDLMNDDQTVQIVQGDDAKPYINILDEKLSVIKQYLLYEKEGSVREYRVSRDGSCVVMIVDNPPWEFSINSLYIRVKGIEGNFNEPILIQTLKKEELYGSMTLLDISFDGNTILYQGDRSGAVAYIVENAKDVQPKITQISEPVSQLGWIGTLSGNGKHAFIDVSDPRSPDDSKPNEYTERRNMVFYSTQVNRVWTKASPFMVDGKECISYPTNIDMDANMFCAGNKIISRSGNDFKIIHTFTNPRTAFWGQILSDDGKTLLFASDDLSTVTTPLWFALRYTTFGDLYKTAMVMVKFEDNQIPAAQTIILDEGYWTQFHFSKKLNRLLWATQKESPDQGTKVKPWNQY